MAVLGGRIFVGRQVVDRLAFERHRVLARLQVNETGIKLRRELTKRLGPPSPRHEKIHEFAVHRLGGPLEVAEGEGAALFAALELRIGLLGDAGLLGNRLLGQTQGLPHRAERTAGGPAGPVPGGGQGGQLTVQIRN